MSSSSFSYDTSTAPCSSEAVSESRVDRPGDGTALEATECGVEAYSSSAKVDMDVSDP